MDGATSRPRVCLLLIPALQLLLRAHNILTIWPRRLLPPGDCGESLLDGESCTGLSLNRRFLAGVAIPAARSRITGASSFLSYAAVLRVGCIAAERTSSIASAAAIRTITPSFTGIAMFFCFDVMSRMQLSRRFMTSRTCSQ